MSPGVHCNQNYSPVAAWESIRILFSTVLRNNWKTMQLGYVLVFPQAPVERECYMNILKGIEVNSDTKWVIKVNNNICRKHQAGRVREKL